MRSHRTGTALLAVVLLLVAGDFSYLAAWALPHTNINWDYVLWPTNFLSPTMEVLHFNSWTPSLPIFFTVLWVVAYGFQTRQRRWALLSALLLGVLFQFKPFAFLVLAAALERVVRLRRARLERSPAVRHRARARRACSRCRSSTDRFACMPIAAPSFAWTTSCFPNACSSSLNLVEAFRRRFGRPMVVAGGDGAVLRRRARHPLDRPSRASGGPQGARDRRIAATWRLLGWGVVAGIAIPFVIVTEPYNDTLQFYQVGLYLLWIFTAAALMSLRAPGTARPVSLPSRSRLRCRCPRRFTTSRGSGTTHERPALVRIDRNGDRDRRRICASRDPQTTVVLNNRPLEPSLLAVLSERRVVLAWGRYAVGSRERLREVEAFYGGTRTLENTLNILRKHSVTHVVVHPERDRVPAEVLAMLRLVMGDAAVQLYEVPDGL